MHKAYLDRQGVEIVFHYLVESFAISESYRIFLRGDDEAWLWHRLKDFVDAVDVLALEVVMVAKGYGGEGLDHRRQVVLHLLGRGDTREQHHVLVLERFQV